MRERRGRGGALPICFSIGSVLLLVAVLTIYNTACVQTGEGGEKMGIIVSIPPQAEFVESVGGDKVAVSVMVPPGADPHTYEPRPNQMKSLSNANMYAKVGSGLEFELVWMDKLAAANRRMLIVDCSEGVQLMEMVGEQDHEDQKEDRRGQQHHTKDPHIWMSPQNAKIMVQNICSGLAEVDPANRNYYERNRDVYLVKLAELDRAIRDGLSGVRNRRFMVYHPSFGYFAREYDLTVLPIEGQGKEPTASGIAHLIQQAKAQNIRVIFASPQFNPQSAQVIAKAIGGKVVFIDPLSTDYTANLRLLLGELVQSME